MKKQFLIFIILLLPFFINAQEYLSPYIKVGSVASDINATRERVIELLKNHNFDVIGSYNPEDKKSLAVVVFTRDDLKNSVLHHQDRGALAAAQKIGLKSVNGQTIISYANPDYFLRAYLADDFQKDATVYQNFHIDLIKALSELGQEFKPFGGKVKASKLKKYHYKITMPHFSDPVVLQEFNSFQQGYNIIKSNLKKHIGNTDVVYVIEYPKQKIAVFGIALKGDWTNSEAYFLPKIGEDNIAAMPYEIILQNNKLSMLDGKYRLAICWPDVSMGTFMSIMTTPPGIRKTFKKLAQ